LNALGFSVPFLFSLQLDDLYLLLAFSLPEKTVSLSPTTDGMEDSEQV
jgi:hypothetical protein